MIGPSIAGVIIARCGVEAAFFINAVSFIPNDLGAAGDGHERAVHIGDTTQARRAGEAFRELGEGISYAFKTPPTFLVIILAFFIGMFGFNFLVALPLVAKYVLDGGPVLLGFLMGGAGTGCGAIGVGDCGAEDGDPADDIHRRRRVLGAAGGDGAERD